MRDYVILTDSCCDLSAEMAAELGVEVLPLSLQMGDRTYRNYLDGREIGFHEFYERVRSGELATTSAVNVGEFEEKMREILKTGKDILSISFSSALSTTYQSSVIAAEELKDEFPDAKILTVDSLCASLGQGLFVYLCAQEQKKGKTIDEVKTFAEETKAADLIDIVFLCGDHDHRCVFRLSDLLTDLKSVHSRQHKIQDKEVELLRNRPL